MRYHNISKDDFLNGDGIRAVLFVSGCTHHCPECHNPVTWSRDGGVEFDAAAKAELFEYLKNDYVSGVTFSGGDPFAVYNREEVLSLMAEVKEAFPEKTVWVYTGWTKAELEEQGFFERAKEYIDVLVEGRFEISKRSVPYHWAGSTNQRVLRKESGFEINTSDPIYEALVEAQHRAEGPDAELLAEAAGAVAKEINPDGYAPEAVGRAAAVLEAYEERARTEMRSDSAKRYALEKFGEALKEVGERAKEAMRDSGECREDEERDGV